MEKISSLAVQNAQCLLELSRGQAEARDLRQRLDAADEAHAALLAQCEQVAYCAHHTLTHSPDGRGRTASPCLHARTLPHKLTPRPLSPSASQERAAAALSAMQVASLPNPYLMPM